MTTSRDARLAAELVANLRSRKDVAAAYGYTPAELKAKFKDPAFRKVLQETKELWTSDANVKERIRAKAGLLVEDALLDIFHIITDPEVNASTRVSSFDSLAKAADVASPSKGGEGGSGFKVIINLPQQEEPVTIGSTYELDGYEDD